MSVVLTRSPLEPIGMNGGGIGKRRSARLSHEGDGEDEPPAKRTKANGATTATVSTKQQDGDNNKAAAKRKARKVYELEDGDFAFSKGKRTRPKQQEAPAASESRDTQAPSEQVANPALPKPAAAPAPPADEPAPKTTQKKTRRRFPLTPERDGAEKVVRRSKRLSDEKASEKEKGPEPSPQRPSHAKSHANVQRGRSPSPGKAAQPVTVEKKRKRGANGVEEEKVMMITLPFADTPINHKNKAMRKESAEGSRRSSAGMRGRRASSMIDDGRGHEASQGSKTRIGHQANDNHDRATSEPSSPWRSDSEAQSLFARAYAAAHETLADEDLSDIALPHAEVPASEFYKHISADLPEPRRMRCLLGWCGARCLPSKPDPPKEKSSATSLEFQAMQAARVIQEELSQDLVTDGLLSDWYSRDESAPPQIPLRKKANPRNITNAAKAEELERELERLKRERAEWDELVEQSANLTVEPDDRRVEHGDLSPLRPDILDSPQRAIFEQLQPLTTDSSADPAGIQARLQGISNDLEFAVDQFAHGVHALNTSRQTAEQVAERSLADAANALEERDRQRVASDKPLEQMDTLRGLARVLNARHR